MPRIRPALLPVHLSSKQSTSDQLDSLSVQQRNERNLPKRKGFSLSLLKKSPNAYPQRSTLSSPSTFLLPKQSLTRPCSLLQLTRPILRNLSRINLTRKRPGGSGLHLRLSKRAKPSSLLPKLSSIRSPMNLRPIPDLEPTSLSTIRTSSTLS